MSEGDKAVSQAAASGPDQIAALEPRSVEAGDAVPGDFQLIAFPLGRARRRWMVEKPQVNLDDAAGATILFPKAFRMFAR